MLSILPFAILLATSFAMLILTRSRSRLGLAWMISILAAMLTWLGVILLHIRFPNALVVSNWLPGGISPDVLRLEFTTSTWILAVCWLGMLVCVVAASSANLEEPLIGLILSGSFAIAAVTLLSILSTSLLSFLVAWTLIDIAEFVLLARTIPDREMMKTEIIDIAFRIAGTFLVVAALAISSSSGGGVNLGGTGSETYALLIAGAALRMGVLPLHSSFTPDEPVRRTLGTLYRLATLVSAFALLIQLPISPLAAGSIWFVYLVSGVAAIFGAVMWATSVNELSGRQYWALSLAGMGMLAVMRGQSNLLIAAACIMIIVGGFLFVIQKRRRNLNFLFVLLLLGASGLPFTPFSDAWLGDWSYLRVFQIAALAILLLGAIRFYEKKEEAKVVQETWVTFFSRVGLIAITLSPWMLMIWKRDFLPLKTGWWYSLILVAFFMAGFFYRMFISRRLERSDRTMQFTRDMAIAGARSLRTFFRFDWLLRFLEWVYRQAQQAVQFLESVLEGEGGVLWSLVFLALLISVLASLGK